MSSIQRVRNKSSTLPTVGKTYSQIPLPSTRSCSCWPLRGNITKRTIAVVQLRSTPMRIQRFKFQAFMQIASHRRQNLLQRVACHSTSCKNKTIVREPEECTAHAHLTQPENIDSAVTTESAAEKTPERFVVANERSMTMHSVLVRTSVYSHCSWSFQGRAKPILQASLRRHGYFICGASYGRRALFE